jgi:hypothetical protein
MESLKKLRFNSVEEEAIGLNNELRRNHVHDALHGTHTEKGFAAIEFYHWVTIARQEGLQVRRGVLDLLRRGVTPSSAVGTKEVAFLREDYEILHFLKAVPIQFRIKADSISNDYR